MKLPYFNQEQVAISEYPSDFIPAKAPIFVGMDLGSPDGGCTVKGFFDPNTGEYHIQEILWANGNKENVGTKVGKPAHSEPTLTTLTKL